MILLDYAINFVSHLVFSIIKLVLILLNLWVLLIVFLWELIFILLKAFIRSQRVFHKIIHANLFHEGFAFYGINHFLILNFFTLLIVSTNLINLLIVTFVVIDLCNHFLSSIFYANIQEEFFRDLKSLIYII